MGFCLQHKNTGLTSMQKSLRRTTSCVSKYLPGWTHTAHVQRMLQITNVEYDYTESWSLAWKSLRDALQCRDVADAGAAHGRSGGERTARRG
eukprot:41579-Eustigmatos_ZCMA.PRE.1